MFIIGIISSTWFGKTKVINSISRQLNSDWVNILTLYSYCHYNSALLLNERQKLDYGYPKYIDFDLLTEHIHNN